MPTFRIAYKFRVAYPDPGAIVEYDPYFFVENVGSRSGFRKRFGSVYEWCSKYSKDPSLSSGTILVVGCNILVPLGTPSDEWPPVTLVLGPSYKKVRDFPYKTAYQSLWLEIRVAFRSNRKIYGPKGAVSGS